MSCATSEPRPLYRLGISVQGAPCWQTELFRLNDDITISGTHVGVTRARQVFPGRDKPDTHGAMILMIEVAATAEGLLPPGNSTVIELGEISRHANLHEQGKKSSLMHCLGLHKFWSGQRPNHAPRSLAGAHHH